MSCYIRFFLYIKWAARIATTTPMGIRIPTDICPAKMRIISMTARGATTVLGYLSRYAVRMEPNSAGRT